MSYLLKDYKLTNSERLINARYDKKKYDKFKKDCQYSKASEIFQDMVKDWFPSEPYCVIIDDKKFCANIKINKVTIHFHLACGYDPNIEKPGSEKMFPNHMKHLVVNKEDVYIKKDKQTTFIIKTTPHDWRRFYYRKDNESKHFYAGEKWDQWDTYQWYVNWLLDINKKKLKTINKENYLKTRSEGEKLVALSLQELKIRYIPEYYVDFLKGDKAEYRLIDFYLPKEDIYIEFNGGLNSLNEEKRNKEIKRYANKNKILENNNLRVINIETKDLSRIGYVLSVKISDLIK
ncbi:hypothetical protein GW835_01005 [archaeon]|nr:hypothetical protein [archaeon]NCP79132.1 hypothetical protein [archaeon]NCP97922.1 hypothetical protein [archaeon]NCQ06899.1 hypothetical protein [archaeon]NCQ50695.1 hypothetical protein [archaeon]